MTSLNALLQSDYFIQLVALGSVILMGLLTYFFGYKSSSSNIDEEILKIEVKETKKQKVEKAKKAEVKDKKKPKATATPATLAPETKQELEKSADVKKPESVKVSSPKPTPKAAKNKNAKVEDVKPFVAAVMPEEEGWTTVTDKKQKKIAAAIVAETMKETKPDATVEKTVVEVVESVQQIEEDSWKTVTDKRQKKNTEIKPESPSPVAESKKSKKAKKMAEIEASAVKVSVTAAPAAVVTEVTNSVVVEETQPVIVKEESEWKTANPKASKKKSKIAPVVEAPKLVEVKKVEAPVVPEAIVASPKTDKKSKKSKPVKEEPVQVPQAIQELITAQLTSPNSIAAAIIEQFKNDNNNNTIVNEKVVIEKVSPEVVVAKKVVTPAAKAGKSQILKTTNLTESMVLIESDGKSNSRTDSNPSSSESLQDLDVGDGWATITSKKKRTVRREV